MKTESSDFKVNVTINSNGYYLQYLGCWGNWGANIPTDIAANSNRQFTLNDNDRGGIWYRAIDPTSQNEIGFVTMSFTCPKMSDNSAEGSPSNSPFVSAGLQTYSQSGHPLNITYNVGTPNLACWSSGSINNQQAVCSETTFKDQRLSIQIENPLLYTLKFGGYWNDNSGGATNWYWAPDQNDMPPPNGKRTIFLKDNDRAGLFIRVLEKLTPFVNELDEKGFANMSFTNPNLSELSAEGSPTDSTKALVSAGLQEYFHGLDIKSITYYVGQSNLACWNSGDSNDGTIVCDQTGFKNRRAVIVINNKTPETLTFDDFWNDNSSGTSNWFVKPNTDDAIPPDCKRIFVLKDNDRAGLYFSQAWIQFHMSFTCPKLSNNSAEGSPHAGLQTYSESGTPVTFVYNVGEPNLACWSSGSSNNGQIKCKQTLVLPFDKRRWMGKLNEKYPDRFKNKKLRQLFIPGAHDSACYSIAMTPWGQTQELDFHDQLINGIRHMDLRPSYVKHDPESPIPESNFFHHGPILTPCKLDDLLSQVTSFYTEDWQKRQYEIIILDFTHFNKYAVQENWNFFFNTILNSSLNNYLIPQGSFGPNTTLNQLWTANANQRVIASVSSDAYTAYQAMTTTKPNIWNGASLFAPGWDGSKFWPDTNDKQKLIDFINNNIDAFSTNTNLWVLQDILTATATQSVYSLAGFAHAALYEPTGLPWRSKANIVIQDYYDERTTIETIMENIKRLPSS